MSYDYLNFIYHNNDTTIYPNTNDDFDQLIIKKDKIFDLYKKNISITEMTDLVNEYLLKQYTVKNINKSVVDMSAFSVPVISDTKNSKEILFQTLTQETTVGYLWRCTNKTTVDGGVYYTFEWQSPSERNIPAIVKEQFPSIEPTQEIFGIYRERPQFHAFLRPLGIYIDPTNNRTIMLPSYKTFMKNLKELSLRDPMTYSMLKVFPVKDNITDEGFVNALYDNDVLLDLNNKFMHDFGLHLLPVLYQMFKDELGARREKIQKVINEVMPIFRSIPETTSDPVGKSLRFYAAFYVDNETTGADLTIPKFLKVLPTLMNHLTELELMKRGLKKPLPTFEKMAFYYQTILIFLLRDFILRGSN